MDRDRLAQCERSNIGIELFAVFGLHLIRALHGAERRRQRTARCVLKRLTGLESRLLSHHTRSTYILSMSVRVHDDPVTGDELDLSRTLVGDLNRVEKEPSAPLGL